MLQNLESTKDTEEQWGYHYYRVIYIKTYDVKFSNLLENGFRTWLQKPQLFRNRYDFRPCFTIANCKKVVFR